MQIDGSTVLGSIPRLEPSGAEQQQTLTSLFLVVGAMWLTASTLE